MESITNDKANENGILIKKGKIVTGKDKNNLSFTAFRESVTRNINEYNKAEKKEKLALIHQIVADLSEKGHPFVKFNNESKCYDVLPIDSKLLKIIKGYFRPLAKKDNHSEETIISKKSTKQPNITSTRTDKTPLADDIQFRNGYRTEFINEIIDVHTAKTGKKTALYKIILDYINTVWDKNRNFFLYNKKEKRYDFIVLKSEANKKLLAKKIAGPATRTKPTSERPSKKDVRIHNGEHNNDTEDGGTEKYNRLINQ